MTSWNRRAGNHNQPRGADEAHKALDQQAILRRSAAEAAPSSQLRARVLTSFDQRMQRKQAWTWPAPATAAAIMVVVVIGLGFWRLRAPGPPTPLPVAPQAIADVRLAAPEPEVQAGHVHTGATTGPRNQHRRPHSVQAKRNAASTDLPFAQFDSLLYCDPFSCGDPMQLIRLEMPAASVGRAFRPLARNGFVSAELIVGADGVTRAVRFTK
jgi:hypothetical protein